MFQKLDRKLDQHQNPKQTKKRKFGKVINASTNGKLTVYGEDRRIGSDILKYCFKHGDSNHFGKDCTMKSKNHKDNATFNKKMVGSTLFC